MFDVQKEILSLDRYTTYWEIKYAHAAEHHCEGCEIPCGCMWVQSEFDSETRILDTYRRFMQSRITAVNPIGQARQAYGANIEFCKVFHPYFWMHGELFGPDAQYYAWRWYCTECIGLKTTEAAQARETPWESPRVFKSREHFYIPYKMTEYDEGFLGI